MKIYDCFTFYNELDLLELRLEELYDHVDHFVLVEASMVTNMPGTGLEAGSAKTTM
jgi:hypothetical protein